MCDEEMCHLKLVEVTNNTLENQSLKAEVILHTQRVCSRSLPPAPLHSFAFCFFSVSLSFSLALLLSLSPSYPPSPPPPLNINPE